MDYQYIKELYSIPGESVLSIHDYLDKFSFSHDYRKKLTLRPIIYITSM